MSTVNRRSNDINRSKTDGAGKSGTSMHGKFVRWWITLESY
jgi:hypothetical protein